MHVYVVYTATFSTRVQSHDNTADQHTHTHTHTHTHPNRHLLCDCSSWLNESCARTRTLTHAHREQGPGERPGAQQHVFVGTKPVLIHGHSQKSALVTLQSKYTWALTFENVQGNLSRVSMGGSLYASNGGGGNSSRVSMGGSLYGPAGGSVLPGKHSVLLQLEDVRVRRQQVLVAFNKYIYTHIGEYIMYTHIISRMCDYDANRFL
jgi:hypothetical protein